MVVVAAEAMMITVASVVEDYNSNKSDGAIAGGGGADHCEC
jgi:hypothetical protein